MNIWVPGGLGMLGRAVVQVARSAGHNVTATTHEDCDISDPYLVKKIVDEQRLDVVINCAGAVHGEDIFDMVDANAKGPHVLAEAVKNQRLIHISTDCVFSGDGDGPEHAVDDLPDPRDPYGRTKLAGEPSQPNVLVVRTSFVGVSGGLGAWLRRQDKREVDGWERYMWNGTSVDVFAQVIVEEATRGHLTGLHHAASVEHVSKFWLLRKLAEIWGLDIRVNPVDMPVVNRLLKPTIELPPLAWALERIADSED